MSWMMFVAKPIAVIASMAVPVSQNFRCEQVSNEMIEGHEQRLVAAYLLLAACGAALGHARGSITQDGGKRLHAAILPNKCTKWVRVTFQLR